MKMSTHSHKIIYHNRFKIAFPIGIPVLRSNCLQSETEFDARLPLPVAVFRSIRFFRYISLQIPARFIKTIKPIHLTRNEIRFVLLCSGNRISIKLSLFKIIMHYLRRQIIILSAIDCQQFTLFAQDLHINGIL